MKQTKIRFCCCFLFLFLFFTIVLFFLLFFLVIIFLFYPLRFLENPFCEKHTHTHTSYNAGKHSQLDGMRITHHIEKKGKTTVQDKKKCFPIYTGCSCGDKQENNNNNNNNDFFRHLYVCVRVQVEIQVSFLDKIHSHLAYISNSLIEKGKKTIGETNKD